MKKFFAVILCVLCALVFCSCKPPVLSKDVGERIYLKYSDMQSYSAKIKMSVYSNKTQNTYDTMQYFKFPDKMRTETDGVVTIINDRTASVKNENTDSLITISHLSDEDDFLFLQNFFDVYYNGENSNAHMNTDDGGEKAVLCAYLGGDNPYRRQAELTLDISTLKPEFFEIKSDGKVYIHIDYLEFKLNDNIDDGLFKI